MKTALLLIVCALLLLSACQTGPMPVPGEVGQPPIKVVPSDEVAPPQEATGLSEMLTIPAGALFLGCDPAHNNSLSCLSDQLPSQLVELPEFKIDKTEVTNAQYAECVQATACTDPSSASSETREHYYDDPQFADFPVVNVSWKQAEAYCAWAGKRLPTEAEWEKAARGAEKPNTFPWGDESPDCAITNARQATSLDNCTDDTQPVGRYPGGASPYGVLDMAGNVWEWTASRYVTDYRPGASEEALTGGPSDLYRVVRGGGWDSAPLNLLISARSFDADFHNSKNLGFRCASD